MFFFFIPSKLGAAQDLSPAPLFDSNFTAVVQDNLLDISAFFQTPSEATIKELSAIPKQILARETLDLRLPCSPQWGFFGHLAGWGQASGSTVNFYQDLLIDNSDRLYDLELDAEKFSMAGIYRQTTGSTPLSIRSNLFLCLDYQKLHGTGLGIITHDPYNQKTVSIDCAYQNYSNTGGTPGLGFSMDWGARLLSDSGMELRIQLNNLPGVVYFEQLTLDDGTAVTTYQSIGPVKIKGLKRQESRLITLPVEINSELALPCPTGKLLFNAAWIGPVGDFSLSYQYPLGDQAWISLGIDPAMDNGRIGMAWKKGELALDLDLMNLQQVRSLNILIHS